MTDAISTAVVGDVIVVDDGCVVDDCFVDVGVVDSRFIHMHDRPVIGEFAAAPLAANEADAHVAEAVVDAAVVSNVRTPVTGVENIESIRPAPIGRRPQRTLVGRGNPGAWNPEVAIISISPVARSPHPSGLRA